jgi:hypothetical protein
MATYLSESPALRKELSSYVESCSLPSVFMLSSFEKLFLYCFALPSVSLPESRYARAFMQISSVQDWSDSFESGETLLGQNLEPSV